jgi:hypothetical protein
MRRALEVFEMQNRQLDERRQLIATLRRAREQHDMCHYLNMEQAVKWQEGLARARESLDFY